MRCYSTTVECRHMGGCGCRAAECCLSCTVDRCLLEKDRVPIAKRHLRQRNAHIQGLRKAGVEIYQLIKASGLTSQSIYRILREGVLA